MLIRVHTVIAALLLVIAACGGTEIGSAGEQVLSDEPVSHGSWRELPVAPIPGRAFAVSGWSGSEAIFWAGTNLERNFAYTRGAAYDPVSDTWRELRVPGWGHPGLAGAVLDGKFYAAAKGGVAGIDPATGLTLELPEIEGFVPATVVASDDAIWAIGPESWADSGPVEVGIARLDRATGTWVNGPRFEGSPESVGLFREQLWVEQPVVWTGSQVVIWHHAGHGLAFDPAAQTWQVLPPLPDTKGTLIHSDVAVAGSALVVLAQFGEGEGFGYTTWNGEAWTDWMDVDLSILDLTTATLAGVPGWLMVSSPEQAPTTVHLASGGAVVHVDAPLSKVQAPNFAWTGEELIVWGGEPVTTDPTERLSLGAAWTPPAD